LPRPPDQASENQRFSEAFSCPAVSPSRTGEPHLPSKFSQIGTQLGKYWADRIRACTGHLMRLRLDHKTTSSATIEPGRTRGRVEFSGCGLVPRAVRLSIQESLPQEPSRLRSWALSSAYGTGARRLDHRRGRRAAAHNSIWIWRPTPPMCCGSASSMGELPYGPARAEGGVG